MHGAVADTCGRARCSSIRGYAVHGSATKHRFPSPLIEASPLSLITHSLTQPSPLSHHLLQTPKKTTTTSAIEKNSVVAIAASKATGEEALVPVQAPVPASAIATGEEAPAGLGQIPLGWDPYEEVDYIRPENPYDTSIADPWSEEDSSNVCSIDGSKDTKTHHMLRRMKSGQYNNFFVGDVYRCPFYPTRRLHATDFNSLMKHAEDVRTCCESVNVHGFIAKHQALGLHLRNHQKVAIEEGRMPLIKPKAPKVKGLGSKKWRRRQREEAEALLVEAMRGH